MAATKDLEAARASAAEQLQASQELVASLQSEQAGFEQRLQAANAEADANIQQAQADLVRPVKWTSWILKLSGPVTTTWPTLLVASNGI